MFLCSSKLNTGHYSYNNTLQISVPIYSPCLHSWTWDTEELCSPNSQWLENVCLKFCFLVFKICCWTTPLPLVGNGDKSFFPSKLIEKKKVNQNQNPCCHDDYLGVFHHLETTALLLCGVLFVIVVSDNFQQTKGKILSGSIFQMPLRWRGWFSFLALCHSVSWAAVSHVYSSHGWR